MKEILKYIAFSLLVINGFIACEEIGPFSSVDEKEFYKTPNDLKAAVVACYNGLQTPMLYEWQLTELRSDNSRVRSLSSNTSTSRNFYQLDQSFVDAVHPSVYEYWSATYRNINNCNQVLLPEHIAVVTDDALRCQYKGEASFIRAYHYFNLVRLYGPVFLVTTPIKQQDAAQKQREPEELVYAQIEEDLKLAIDSLPQDYTHSTTDIGRATSMAAKGLLAKVYITQKRFADAYGLLDNMVNNSGIYGLESKYADVFSINNEMNKEILFTVRYRAGGYGIGSPFANLFAPNNSGSNVVNGDGGDNNIPTEDLKRKYLPGDERATVNFALGYYDPLLVSASNPTGFVKNRSYCNKYLSEVLIKSDAENDWPVLRWADILLMYAETINETAPDNSVAFTFLNQVQSRAGLSGNQLATAPKTRQEFRTLIEKERRLELAFENHRWFDLLRTGRIVEIINTHYDEETAEGSDNLYYVNLDYANMGNYNALLPIPQKEIDVNPQISQNPGY